MKWICTRRKPQRCPGKIMIKDDIIVKGSSHECPPDFARNVTDKTLYIWKPHLLSSVVPAISQVYKSIVESLKNIGVDQEDLPSIDRVKSMMYRYKNRLMGIGSPKKVAVSKAGKVKKGKYAASKKGKIGSRKGKSTGFRKEKIANNKQIQENKELERVDVKSETVPITRLTEEQDNGDTKV